MGYLLGLLCFGAVLAQSMACPQFCSCDGLSVTCTEFIDLDLSLLPADAETLVLIQGQMEEIPPAFFASASNLKNVELTNFNARVVRGGAFRGELWGNFILLYKLCYCYFFDLLFLLANVDICTTWCIQLYNCFLHVSE